ncbi:hypothetical protein M409DRAFT_64209 [Zasmidium cellare ATCC 36951]|uniref:Major facilitator superfamily (MFS) profile domain-containing protein n=1 Tax=Zasmidium cellare ATCC 36951 TaxID=1080233 RepID=A0A6A6CYL4_ZASCE|nr:uncharacterized protein M409DRAFT_64209 [Zasmidium cellare ATCC 36951]KAF2170476.1 hypothetical protein M409DRAFT_64209 [Zasmidium cellare ATCC 36951]
MIPLFRHFNTRLAFSCDLIALSTFNYGFDNQGFSTTQAMDAFTKQFGTYVKAHNTYVLPPWWLSLFNSLIYVGFAAGVIIGGVVSSRFGRKTCVFAMSIYTLITATIIITSKTPAQILAARVLNYVYIGMELSVCPVFQSEIVPVPIRGLMVGSYQLSLVVGGLVINCVCRGTENIHGNAAWRIPFGLFYIVPSIVAVGIWCVPESPRWLLLHDRHEEARQNLYLLRKSTKSDEEIDEEFAAMSLAILEQPEPGQFKDIWTGSNLKRTIILLLVNFFQQATGQAFVSSYGVIFIKSLNTVNAFDMAVINAGVNIFSLLLCLLLVDEIGRRPFLSAGTLIQAAALFAMAGLGASSTLTDSIKIGIVAVISVSAFGFSIAWGPVTYIVTTELMSVRLRDVTSRVAFLVGFIYGAIAVCGLVFVLLCIPECKGKSLEQIDLLFEQGVPLRKFKHYHDDIQPEALVFALSQSEKAQMCSMKECEDVHT